jgi:hypothetical protein
MDAFRAENTRPVVLAEATPVQYALNTHRIFKMESNQSLIRLALGPKYVRTWILCVVLPHYQLILALFRIIKPLNLDIC